MHNTLINKGPDAVKSGVKKVVDVRHQVGDAIIKNAPEAAHMAGKATGKVISATKSVTKKGIDAVKRIGSSIDQSGAKKTTEPKEAGQSTEQQQAVHKSRSSKRDAELRGRDDKIIADKQKTRASRLVGMRKNKQDEKIKKTAAETGFGKGVIGDSKFYGYIQLGDMLAEMFNLTEETEAQRLHRKEGEKAARLAKKSIDDIGHKPMPGAPSRVGQRTAPIGPKGRTPMQRRITQGQDNK